MFEWFGDAVWQEWRATLTAVGALIALGVAGRTYALNSREQREKHARLLYSELIAMRRVPEGTESIFPKEERLFAAVNHAGWRTAGPLKGNAVLATVEVHNRSDEAMGPVSVRLSYADRDWRESPGLTVDTLHPSSSVRVHLLGTTEFSVGLPIVMPSILYRDSAGKWWKRKGTDPIELLRQEPRLAGAVPHYATAEYEFISSGDGFKSTLISSEVVLWFFEVVPRVPGLRWLVNRLALREKAEARALRKLHRSLPLDDLNDAPTMHDAPTISSDHVYDR